MRPHSRAVGPAPSAVLADVAFPLPNVISPLVLTYRVVYVAPYEYSLPNGLGLLAESGMADELNGKVITTVESPIPLAQAVALQAAAKELGVELTHFGAVPTTPSTAHTA